MRRMMTLHDCPRADRIARLTGRHPKNRGCRVAQSTQAREVADGIGFGVLTLTSNNPGMRRNIETTKRTIDHALRDHAAPVQTDTIVHDERSAHDIRRMAERLDAISMEQRRQLRASRRGGDDNAARDDNPEGDNQPPTDAWAVGMCSSRLSCPSISTIDADMIGPSASNISPNMKLPPVASLISPNR